MRTASFIVILATGLCCRAVGQVASSTVTNAEEASARAFVEKAIQTSGSDVKTYVDLLSADYDLRAMNGMFFARKDMTRLQEDLAARLKQNPRSPGSPRTVVDRIRIITPDVAIADTSRRLASGERGNEQGTVLGVLVLRKQDGSWQIVAHRQSMSTDRTGQNTERK